MNLLTEDNQRCLREGIALLHRIPAAFYATPFDEGSGASLGDHIRHNLDHYDCFLGGWESGRIDYDARSRDLTVATDPATAIASMERIDDALEVLKEQNPHEAVQVQMDSGSGEGGDSWTASSLGREMQFLLSHTIHHYALIAILCRLRGIEPGETFGVAPSTLRHRSGALAR